VAENPDGQQVLIVTNSGARRTIELRLVDMAAPVPLQANSVTTMVWKKFVQLLNRGG
jgi:O-glycosyl hydrolase